MFVQPGYLTRPEVYEEARKIEIPNASKKQKMHEDSVKITPYKTFKRGNPTGIPELEYVEQTGTAVQRGWCLAHALIRQNADGSAVEPSKQIIGSYSGFQASIYHSAVKNKAHYHLTFPKPPTKSVANEVMSRCIKAVDAKKMPFIQLVGDQPVFALIVKLKFENPEKYSKLIPVLGGFHTQNAFMSTIYKRFKGSGIEDLVIAADLIEAGSVEQALRGKHHNCGIRIYKLVHEALVRVLISSNAELKPVPPQVSSLVEKIRSVGKQDKEMRIEIYEDLLAEPSFKGYLNDLYVGIEASNSSKTRYWLSFLEMVEVLLLHYHSMRCQNWENYLLSIRLMLPWMAVYDNLHYSRYLSIYWSMMKNLNDEVSNHMKQGLFSASLSGLPFSAIPYDQWIEVTMNKGSKMKGGWSGITKNEAMLNIHTKTVNKIMKVHDTLKASASMKREKRDHIANAKSRLVKDETAVQALIGCIDEWDCNPWSSDESPLCTPQSGFLASEKLIGDFESAKSDGERQVDQFFEERILSSEKLIRDRIKLNKRASFVKPPKEQVNITTNKATDGMENKAMVSLLNIAESAINLEEVMKHPVTPVSLPLFNLNGTLRKTVKAKLVDCFKLEQIETGYSRVIAVIDMGLLWRVCIPRNRETADGEPYTWNDYASKLFDAILRRHPNAAEYHLINDRYDVALSVKDSDHGRRSANYIGGAVNVFPRRGAKIPQASRFDAFFANASNKIRLQAFLLGEIKQRIEGREEKFFYTNGEKCIVLNTGEEIRVFDCRQHEADTRIFFHISVCESRGGSRIPFIVDSEDTDVLAIASSVAHKCLHPIYLYRRGLIYDCGRMCSLEISSIIVQLYALTGADAISGFYGLSKQTIFARVAKSENAKSLLADLGQIVQMSNRCKEDIEKFTIRYIYTDKKSESLPQARASKWRSLRRKTTSRIPPDADTLLHHMQRANYQTFIWLSYHDPSPPPSPLQHGWFQENGRVLPIKHSLPPLPRNLQELLITAEENHESSSDNEADWESDVEVDSFDESDNE